VLVAASRRPQVVKAVSSQVPFVHGLSSALRYPIRHQPAAMWMAIRDAVRGDGEEPVYMPIISADGGTAALICDECVEGYSKLVPKGQEAENKVAARFLFSLPFFYPIDSAPKVQAPTLVIAAERDGLIPIQKVRDTAKACRAANTSNCPARITFRLTRDRSSSRWWRARRPSSGSIWPAEARWAGTRMPLRGTRARRCLARTRRRDV